MRAFGLVAGLAVVLGLAGCVGFQGPIKGKQTDAGHVLLKFGLCKGDSTPECTDQGQGAEANVRLLVGLRLPPGTSVPNRIKPDGVNLRFRRDDSYTDALNAAAPKTKGGVWVGYASSFRDTATLPDTGRFEIRAGLPDDIGGRFFWRPVAGFTFKEDSEGPIDCGHGSEPWDESQDFDTTCIDAPDTREQTERSFKIKLD